MKSFIIIVHLIFILPVDQLPAQGSNRVKVIDMILQQSSVKIGKSIRNYVPQAPSANIPAEQTSSLAFRTITAVPKYNLAKGAVICRLEEYVQLHSPFKLNIGVGGE